MIKKKIPLRKCTGCQQMKEKKELIRVVRTDENQYTIDLTGRMSGRGAYICKNIECLEKAFKSKGLERSFKSAIPKDIYEKLRNELVLNE
ncbi:RNase P modulator RnpM [[Clostridium] colinum]|uniref:RNase P modulator RnpM n=1 Tax=[Clostridium] colinum TaxID=36835 RepID=UPI002025AFA4|nr:YlxR family protein [[Clostridium] colinum]